ncbi:hypothetical protein BSKO_07686 [Bryopsis sp. KO-2023]|nr:hypothetical protein BSKO_07686 [Bryopsis sp. KO-2023]
MAEWRRGAGMAMRLFLAVFVVGGLGSIIFGCILEIPPKSLPSMGMVMVGVLTLMAAMFGYCGSYGQDCCLKMFLSMALVSLALQASFVLALHFDFDKVLETIHDGKDKQRVVDTLKAGKWIFVVMLAAEVIAFFIAIILRCCRSNEPPFDALEDPTPIAAKRDRGRDRSNVALQKLRTDIVRNKEDSASNYERVRQKMQKKYGKFSHGVDWGKKKRKWYFF